MGTVVAAAAVASAVERTGRTGRVQAEWIEAPGKDWRKAEVECLHRGLRCVEEPAAEAVADRDSAGVAAAGIAADIGIVVVAAAVQRRSPVEVGRRHQVTVLAVSEPEAVRATGSVGQLIVECRMDSRERRFETESFSRKD